MSHYIVFCRYCGRKNYGASYAEASDCACRGGRASTTRASNETDCVFRGQEISRQVCPSCRGHVEVKVFACKVHGQCTLYKAIDNMACCATCLDRRSSPASATSEIAEVADGEACDVLAKLVTIIVVSFKRFNCLAALLRSIRANYPQLRVIVADQSGEEAETNELAQWCRKHPQVEWLSLPYDCGLSAARNAAVAKVRTPFTWLMDDDFVVLPSTDAVATLRLLVAEVKDAVLAAGPIYDLGTKCVHDWAGTITVLPGSPPVVRAGPPWPWQRSERGTLWRPTGRFLNSFIAKTDVLRRIRWHDDVKISGEHRLFLADMAVARLLCIVTPALTLAHQADRRADKNYLALRARKQWYNTSDYRFVETDDWRANEEPAPLPALDRPSRGVVVLTPGHTGSRVVARLLSAMGWHIPNGDPVFGEAADVRAINQRIFYGEHVPMAELRSTAQAWPRPWVIKDPRLSEYLDLWLPVLVPDAPLLLLLERDLEAVKQSFEKRNEPVEVLHRRLKMIEHHWNYWPWEKRRIRFEDVCTAWERLPEPSVEQYS